MSSTGAIWSKQQSNVKREEYTDFYQMISDKYYTYHSHFDATTFTYERVVFFLFSSQYTNCTKCLQSCSITCFDYHLFCGLDNCSNFENSDNNKSFCSDSYMILIASIYCFRMVSIDTSIICKITRNIINTEYARKRE